MRWRRRWLHGKAQQMPGPAGCGRTERARALCARTLSTWRPSFGLSASRKNLSRKKPWGISISGGVVLWPRLRLAAGRPPIKLFLVRTQTRGALPSQFPQPRAQHCAQQNQSLGCLCPLLTHDKPDYAVSRRLRATLIPLFPWHSKIRLLPHIAIAPPVKPIVLNRADQQSRECTLLAG